MKIEALSELELRPDPNGRTFHLLSDYSVSVDRQIIIVPKGYETDLTSGWRVVRPFVPKWGKYGFGAVIHDYLYDDRGFTQKEADKIFYNLMKHYKTKWTQRWIIMVGVFLMGWVSFGNREV